MARPVSCHVEGQDGGLTLGAHRAEEVDGFVVGIGQTDRYNHVTGTNVEGRMDETRDMELLQGHFTALLQLNLAFAVLGGFQLHGLARTAGLELYLSAQYPLGVELIVKSQHKTGGWRWCCDGRARCPYCRRKSG